MSAACLDTSEPAIPMATPISAFLRAGESLTPSPVTATIAPILWQPSTMISFCWGEVLANTISVWYIRISSICFSLMSLISLGLTSLTSTPFLAATSSTVSVPSEMIPTDLGTAALGGSIIDIRPTNLRPSRGKLTSSASKGYPLGYLSSCDHLIDGFAAQLTDDFLQTSSISIDSDGGEDLLEVSLLGGIVSTQNSEKVCGKSID